MSYLYQLEKYQTNNRYKCPNCGKSKFILDMLIV